MHKTLMIMLQETAQKIYNSNGLLIKINTRLVAIPAVMFCVASFVTGQFCSAILRHALPLFDQVILDIWNFYIFTIRVIATNLEYQSLDMWINLSLAYFLHYLRHW